MRVRSSLCTKIGILIIAIIIMVLSFIYKKNKTDYYRRNYFPLEQVVKKDSNKKFYLIFIFSKKSCSDCMSIAEFLNKKSYLYEVMGLVPDKEIKDINVFKNMGVKFRIRKLSLISKKYIPHYWPCIYGVRSDKKIFFVLPAVPGEKEWILDFLDMLFYKIKIY